MALSDDTLTMLLVQDTLQDLVVEFPASEVIVFSTQQVMVFQLRQGNYSP